MTFVLASKTKRYIVAINSNDNVVYSDIGCLLKTTSARVWQFARQHNMKVRLEK